MTSTFGASDAAIHCPGAAFVPATGITSVKAGEEKTMKRYTLDGKAANNSQRGLNIIQMSDGTTKKVVVK